jgi:phage terminase large subunit-like protein
MSSIVSSLYALPNFDWVSKNMYQQCIKYVWFVETNPSEFYSSVVVNEGHDNHSS